MTLVLQISLVDVISSFVACLEVLSVKVQSWNFPADICPVFTGTEVLVNALTLYLIIAFNFHVISIMNLHIFEMQESSKNPFTSCEDDESNECLVRKLECTTRPTRNMTIDYRKRKHDISVIIPSILVWLVCLSLSIPEFTLSSTIKTKGNSTLCTIVDLYHGKLCQNLLIVFRVFIPTPLLALSLFIMLWKLYQSKFSQRILENILTKKSYNVQQILIFSIILTLTYFVTSFIRQYLYVMNVLTQKFSIDSIDSFKIPPIHNIRVSYETNTYLSVLHYSAMFVRSLLYVLFLPKFATLIKSTLLPCCYAEK